MRRRLAALGAAVVLLVPGCAAGQGPADSTPSPGTDPKARSSWPDGAKSLAEPANPLGSKWDWSMPTSVAAARQLRGGSTFYEVERCSVLRRPGQYDWRRVDSIVRRTERLGYALMLKIRAGSCATRDVGRGARDRTESQRTTPSAVPDDMSAYQDFVRALVQRYSARGVHWYSIENEIDTLNFWADDVAGYARLAKRTAETVRATDPAARLIDPGLSSTAYGVVLADELLAAGEQERAVATYRAYYGRRLAGGESRFPAVTDPAGLRRVLAGDMGRRALAAAETVTALDRAGVFDVYQLHYYEPLGSLPAVLSWIRRQVPDRMPVEAWEAGVAWPGGSYDEDGHADETAKVTAALFAAGVRRVVYLPLAMTPRLGKRAVFRGIFEPTGAVLPAGQVYQRLTKLLGGEARVEPVRADGLDGIAVSEGDETEFVLWSTTGDRRIDVAADTTMASPTGSPMPARRSVRVGRDAVFLDWPAALPAAQRALTD